MLREFYEWIPTAEIADELGCKASRVWAMANKLGLRKAPELIAEMSRERSPRPDHGGRAHQFQKGIVPHNKGKKMPGFAPGRMRETQFKKGQDGWNYMPVGARRVIDGYLYEKVSDIRKVPYTVNWKPVHHLRWSKKHGPIPESHVLVFKDGDRMNTRLSNLELIHRRDLVRRNHWKNLPPALQEVILLKGAINSMITKREKRHAKEQNERSA